MRPRNVVLPPPLPVTDHELHLDAPPHGAPRRRRRWGRRIAQVVVGLALGAGIAEAVFHHRDHGAFPHVNFYVPDAELGVRLEPDIAMRFRFRNNPASDIHTNAMGYRGADWPAVDAANDEILVLGDSQVFGLGVEDDETFSARIAAQTGRTVINAGVPTYGPGEYLAILRELLASRKPTLVVYTINFANDGFELTRPNRERHAVWDGWAVRVEHAPPESFEFPGRRWLFRNSHAFYAARRWWHEVGEFDTEGEKGPTAIDVGVPSEGTWHDLIRTATATEEIERISESASVEIHAAQRRELAQLPGRRSANLDDITAIVDDDYEWTLPRALASANPGDIVDDDSAEEARFVLATAALVRRAVEERERRVKQLAERAADDDPIRELVNERETLAKTEVELRRAVARGPAAPQRVASIYVDHIAEVKAECDAHGAELLVVALPIDVQVSSEEWAKYGAEAIDMAPTLALLDDTVEDARTIGARGLNPTAALRAAEPGAFLDGDIHMTATGHAALASAIVVELDAPLAPRPIPGPRPGLREGLLPQPAARVWVEAPEVLVKGSTDAGCRTQIVDGWFRVACRTRGKSGPPTAVTIEQGAVVESMTLVTPDAAILTTPITAGHELRARFDWKKRSLVLHVTWPEGKGGAPKFTGAFAAAPAPQGREPVEDAAATRLCECHQSISPEITGKQVGDIVKDYEFWIDDERPVCTEVYGGRSAACFAAFALHCDRLLACVAGDPLAAPTCAPHETLIAATNTCVTVCDDARPCAHGTCEPYNDGGICREKP